MIDKPLDMSDFNKRLPFLDIIVFFKGESIIFVTSLIKKF